MGITTYKGQYPTLPEDSHHWQAHTTESVPTGPSINWNGISGLLRYPGTARCNANQLDEVNQTTPVR